MSENELATTLDDVGNFINDYVVISKEQKDILSLWTMNTHCFGINEFCPYLAVTAPVKRAGKSTLLEILSTVTCRPWLTGRVTAAVLVRKIDQDMPTLLLDESDTVFTGNNAYGSTLRGVLNTGYRRGGNVAVMQGGAITQFSSYCPKAFAGIGELPETIADRAIPIRLNRRMPTEEVKRLRHRDIEEESTALKLRLAQWVIFNRESLSESRPNIPSDLNDRAADVCESLFAIADLAGKDWGRRARKAAIKLFTPEIEEDEETILFSIIKDAWEQYGESRMSSMQLATMVSQDVGVVKMNPRKLAEKLRGFGLHPTTVRLPDGRIKKGYKVEDFEEAINRYVS